MTAMRYTPSQDPALATPIPGGPARAPRVLLHLLEAGAAPSLTANFAWTLAANIAYVGSQAGILMILAKLGSPEMVGQLALALVLTTPVVMLTNLQLRSVQATDAARDYRFGDYLGLRLLTTAVALPLILLVTLGAGYRHETASIILTVGVAKAIEAVSDIYYGLLQQRERMDLMAASMITKGVLSLIVVGLALRFTGSLVWASLGLLASWTTVLFAYDLPFGSRVLAGPAGVLESHRHFREPRLGKLVSLARLAFPLGCSTMLISLTLNMPRYFVERFLGRRELGIFAALSYLVVVGTTVVNALGQAATPRLARHFAGRQPAAFRYLLWKLVALVAFFGLLGIGAAVVLGRPLLTVLYTREFAERQDVLVWLMMASAIGYVYSVLSYGSTTTRRFRHLMVPYMGVTAIAAACGLLVPHAGLRGAAWGIGIVNAISCAIPVAILCSVDKSLLYATSSR